MSDLDFVIEMTNEEFRTNIHSSPILRDILRDWVPLLNGTPCTMHILTVILLNMINTLHDLVEIKTEQLTYLGTN
jgi:hypothetical protein